jgi:hypothetical protein
MCPTTQTTLPLDRQLPSELRNEKQELLVFGCFASVIAGIVLVVSVVQGSWKSEHWQALGAIAALIQAFAVVLGLLFAYGQLAMSKQNALSLRRSELLDELSRELTALQAHSSNALVGRVEIQESRNSTVISPQSKLDQLRRYLGAKTLVVAACLNVLRLAHTLLLPSSINMRLVTLLNTLQDSVESSTDAQELDSLAKLQTFARELAIDMTTKHA